MFGALSSSIFNAFPAQLIFALFKTFIITTDAGTESSRTFPCIFFQNPTALSSHFPRIPFRIPQSSPKTFYYFSFHDQNASYRASL